MLKVLVVFVAGIILGSFFKKFNFLNKFSEISVYILIAIFLFVIGFSVGSDKRIIQNLNITFLYSLIFSISGILGSVLLIKLILKK